MEDHKEKKEEKVLPLESENPIEDKSVKKEEVKSESKSEDSEVSEINKLRNDLKAQAEYQSKIQKELNESKKVIDAFKTAFVSEEEGETDVVTPEAVKTQLENFQKTIAEKDAELAKNSYIDGLQQPEAVKRYLKAHVKPSGELEAEVEKELDIAKELISSAVPTTTDSRPKGLGVATGSHTDMSFVLEHPELYKK